MRNNGRIKQLLKNSGKKERFQLQVACSVTMFVTLLFAMFAFGLSDITNESLSDNDLQQLMGILSSVILVSIIAIVFFQWILSIQIKMLLDIRRQFSDSLLLMGTTKKKIVSIYMSEWCAMHIKALLFGGITSVLFYAVLASIFEIEEKSVPIKIIVIAIIIDTMLGLFTMGLQLFTSLKGNIIENIRNRNQYTKEKNISNRRIIIRLILALMALVCPIYISNSAVVRQISELSKLLSIVAIIILFDPIVRGIYIFIDAFSKKFKLFNLLIAEKISRGYFSRIKVSCMFLILSCTIFVGLHSMFNMVREAGEVIVNDNIKYNYVTTLKELNSEKMDSDKNTFYGLKTNAQTESGTNIFINGIDELYLESYEKINVVSGSENALQKLAEEKSNGIFMPELFASSDDIGKTIQISINGTEHEFQVVGLYYSNDFSELRCLVNIDYLRQELQVNSGGYNIIFSKGQETIINVGNTDTKVGMAQKSKDRAVNGTEIIEAITYLLLVCAIISLLTYYSLISSSNEKDIIRFQAAGMGINKTRKIYLLHAIFPVFLSGLFIIPITNLFTKICLYVMLSPYYFVQVEYSSIWSEALIIIMFAIISVFVQLFYLRKKGSKNDFIYTLKENAS